MPTPRSLSEVHAAALAGTLELPARAAFTREADTLRTFADSGDSPDWSAQTASLKDALAAFRAGDYAGAARLLDTLSMPSAVALRVLCYVHMARRGEMRGTTPALDHLRQKELRDLRSVESKDPSGRLARVRAALEEFLNSGALPPGFVE